MNGDYLLIIDGSSLLSTQFFGNLPREILFAKTPEEKEKYFHKIMKTTSGVYTNAVYGFLKALFKMLQDQNPTYLAVTWDITRETFRRKMFPPYKATRSETMKPLSDQFDLMQRVLKEMGVAQFMSEEFEADDYSGSLAKKFESEIPVRILTKDHDYLQLITENTHLWMLQTSKDKADELYKKYKVSQEAIQSLPEKVFEFDPETEEKEFFVKPSQIPSLKGLQGDFSDNIPGVKGVGPETAWRLIRHYGNVSSLYDDLTDLNSAKEKELKARWKEELGIARSPLSALLKDGDSEVTEENKGEGLSGKSSALLSEVLATIKTDIPLKETLEDLRTNLDLDAASRILNELEIHSLSLDFSRDEEIVEWNEKVDEITDFDAFTALLDDAKRGNAIGTCYSEEEGLYLAFSPEKVCLVKEAFFITKEVMKSVLLKMQEKGAILMTLDGKTFYKQFGICTKDVTIGAYLLNPLLGSYDLSYIAQTYAAKRVPQKALSTGSQYLTALLPALTYEPISAELKAQKMDRLYEDIELKTMICLAEMEEAGIRVEKDELRAFSEKLSVKIDSLTSGIYALSGMEFNLNSPKQLSDVLFVKLGIPYPKKGTKYSTNADILEKLQDEYEIVAKILEYRTYQKLRATYAEGLQSYISEDGRIYGTFQQTVTATGRISSQNPNLQNIPVRLALGQEIRKLFVPKEGCLFIDADYSQIELRVMAHMSQDENLIRAYNEGQDIHTLTAASVFHVAPPQVTKQMRSSAKAVNFGIIYGISAFSLAEDLQISKKEAEVYIERYFEAYPKIKTYLDETVKEAGETGAVKTLFGRVRPIPELKSESFHERAFGERVAMNSPIQGTAADIMKLAVIRVNEGLKEKGLKARIVLQVHDEIIIETPFEEAEQVEKVLKEGMENAAKLSVTLSVEAKRGASWYETK